MGRKSLAAAQLAFPSATSSLAAPSLFSLQRTIGNRATQKLLTRPLRRNRRAGTLNNYSDQRADYDLEPMLLPWRSRFRLMKVSAADAKIQYKKLTEEEKAADLQSDPLKHDARLQTAFDNSPLMTTGERSEGVKTLQRALRDLGYPMAVSFAKTGDADGIFGSETYKAVYQFQVDHTLQYKDGIVDRETLLTLDQLLLGQQTPCNINYAPGPLGYQERKAFVEKNFSLSDRSRARKILDDLCQVAQGTLSFESEQELRDEIFKRLKVSQYMQESQTTESFEYPEAATDCPGKTGNALANAQVNKAAKDYWKGPILEQRPKVKNRHYYFELTEDKGKNAGYDALKLLFTPQSNICDRTLIHCDSLITLAKMLAYADTIGQESFDAKIKSGTLQMWLTYDGMSAVENGKSTTPVTEAYFSFEPANEEDLVIGDHVVFWNHLAYDAISLRNPGPWRLENALLVDKDASGNDLFEGHGAPSVGGTVKPGTKEDILKDLMNTFNAYAKDALELTARVDANEAGAEEELAYQYPWVTKINGVWYVEEIPRNKDRPIHFYPLREITDVNDPELIGLHNPYAPAKLSPVMRPIESK
jgi:Putative peptidoglycan binding domain